MDLKQRKNILKQHQLRITDCRLDILDFFITMDHALSQKDLEDSFSGYDRVTLYRTLHAFISNGILHRIPDDSGFARYGVCYKTCTSEAHHHTHAHFKCRTCGQITCLPDQMIPLVELPDEFVIESSNLILEGTCKSCN